MKSTSSSLSKEQDTSTELQQCKERIAFIIHQIESLEHYLPETYQMLMDELDQQHLKLKHLEIRDFYYRQNNAEQDKTRQLIQEIKSKVKNRLTTQREFPSDDAVIDHAVSQLHQDLKKRGLL